MPQDRANQPLKKGDLVTFVYGGDLHTATVVGFDVDPVTKLDRAVLEATLYIPTATVHALDKADTKPEPLPTGVAKNPGGYDETQPDAAHTLSPETAVQVHRDAIERQEKEVEAMAAKAGESPFQKRLKERRRERPQ